MDVHGFGAVVLGQAICSLLPECCYARGGEIIRAVAL